MNPRAPILTSAAVVLVALSALAANLVNLHQADRTDKIEHRIEKLESRP